MRRHADHAHRGVPNGDQSVESPKKAAPTSTAIRKRPRTRPGTTKVAHKGWGHRGGSSGLHPRIIVSLCFIGGALLFIIHIILFRVALISSAGHDTDTTQHNPGPAIGAAIDGADTSSPPDGMDKDSLAIYEDQLTQAMEDGLADLGPIDREKYTIRINTWRRNEQLIVSLNHHAKCEGVAQIQVVWCDYENEPPDEVVHHTSGKVVVERHVVNSLNERFNILTEDTPTLGVLSIDDDVLRPCDAIDAGFFRWVSNPERLVGYDARLHIPDMKSGHFEYGYKSATEKYNRYSITLPRYCFVHKDYLNLYMSYVPEPILQRVEEKFECEDIALSFFVSALTDGNPPLLADFWATKALVKLYSPAAISGTLGHKKVRDQCVEDFLIMLGLKVGLKAKLLVHELWHEDNIMFGFGAEPDPDLFVPLHDMVPRHARLAERVKTWMNMSKGDMNAKVISPMMRDTSTEAVEVGLIEGTAAWKKRWKGTKAK